MPLSNTEMRRHHLRGRARRKYRATTDSTHDLPVAKDLLDRQFTRDRPTQAWVSDITAIATHEGGDRSMRDHAIPAINRRLQPLDHLGAIRKAAMVSQEIRQLLAGQKQFE